MSSEYSIHLGDRHIASGVFPLSPELTSTVVRLTVGDGDGGYRTEEKCVLYVKDDRLLEMSLLFHKISQDLARLLDMDACRCQGEAHQGCIVHEQCQVDTIPREEAAEHVEPPHRWG